MKQLAIKISKVIMFFAFATVVQSRLVNRKQLSPGKRRGLRRVGLPRPRVSWGLNGYDNG